MPPTLTVATAGSDAAASSRTAGTIRSTTCLDSGSTSSGATIRAVPEASGSIALDLIPSMPSSRCRRSETTACTCGCVAPARGCTVSANWPARPCPGPVISSLRIRSASTTGSSEGSWPVPMLSVRRSRTGSASTISRLAAPSNHGHGRRMMRPAKRPQNEPAPGVSRAPTNGTRPRSTERPTMCSRAGSSVAAATIATAVTSIAAPAIDCTARTGISQTVPSDTITVRPENTTAVPDVRIASRTAAACSTPRRISSR